MTVLRVPLAGGRAGWEDVPASRTVRAPADSMTTTYHIRLATPADARLLATHRVAMFRDMGCTTRAVEQPLLDVCEAYFATALASGEYVGWVAETAGPPPMRSAARGCSSDHCCLARIQAASICSWAARDSC